MHVPSELGLGATNREGDDRGGLWDEGVKDLPLLVCQVTFMAHSCVNAVKQSAQRPVGRRLVELLPDGRQFAGQTTRVAMPELSGMSRWRSGQSTLDAWVRPFHRTTLQLRLRTQESAATLSPGTVPSTISLAYRKLGRTGKIIPSEALA